MNKAPVEQAGGDERAAFEAWMTWLMDHVYGRLPDFTLDDGSGAHYVNADVSYAWTAWQARAALAQPSPLPVSNIEFARKLFEEMALIADDEKCIRMLAGALTQSYPAQSEQAEAERPEVAEVAFVLRNIGAMDAEDIDGDNVDLRFEDAEGRDTGCDVSIVEYAEKAADLFEQHDRIVGELRADRDSWAEQAEQRLADWDEMRKERDAALARVAKMEACGAPALLAAADYFAERAKGPSPGWVTLSAVAKELRVRADKTTAAQAQHSVPEGWMLVECGIWTQEQVDEMQKTVTRFRNSEFVDDRALAMAVADAGQCKAPEISLAELLAAAPGNSAQHSVPETTNEEANSFLRVADAGQFKDNAAAVRTAAMIIRGLLHRPAIMKSIIRHRIGLTPEYEGQWHADMYGEDGEVQHHAEADTPDEAVRAVVALAAEPGKEGV
ncbi:TPA: hypothetical protein ACNIH6_004161 [Pseudomonas aeruginosa]